MKKGSADMAVTGLTGVLADDHLLAAISNAEFGDPAALDPNKFRIDAFIVKADPATAGETVVEYNVKTK